MITHEELKNKALKRKDVREEYDNLEEEFSYLDEFLKARMGSGLTQAEIARMMGTTQSVVARLETGKGRHSPSIATLTRYAKALGLRLELKLVENR
ncbi:MAG: helix-turn-helix transcriptional regulator [Proteobacteria bacterium]|nr:helix-turn-helix transcriptional regulator [Pseudomonadota bacterium]